MAQNNKIALWLDPQVNVILGTEPRKLEALRRSIAGKNSDVSNLCAIFDSRRTVSVSNAVLSDQEQDVNDLFSTEEFIDAIVPKDSLALTQHEDQGNFSRLTRDWYKAPGAALDDYGAGGQPAVGYTMALVTRNDCITTFKKMFGRCVDHGKRLSNAVKGASAHDIEYRILVHVHCAAVGGMGSGAALKIPDYIHLVTADYHIQPKLIADVLLRGDLAVKDLQKADINQVNLLKHLRAWASGEFVDPVTGKVQKNPIDLVFLQSNQNCHGRFASLEQLQGHEAYRQNIMWNSTLTPKIRERLVDIEGIAFDPNGDPLPGYTASISGIRRDTVTITDYCINNATAMIAEVLTGKSDTGQAQQDAAAFARMHGVVESQDESRLTSRILMPEEFKGESCIQRLTSNFAARAKGYHGLNQAQTLAETIQSITGVEFTSLYESAMTKDALIKNAEVTSALNEALRQRSSVPEDSRAGRYSEIPALLAGYKRVIAASISAVTAKIGPLQEASQLHMDAVNQALLQLAQIEQMSWLGRLRHFFLIREIAACLEESGLAYLTLEMQILACKVAIQHILDKQMESVDGLLMRYTVLEQDLRQISAAAKQRAQRLAQRKTGYEAAPFFELENQDYLESFFDKAVAADGGQSLFTEKLIARLIHQHGSLNVLPGKEGSEIETLLNTVCREVFEPAVARGDVVTEFKNTFSDPKKQIRILRSLMLQSEGSVHTVGEAGSEITWLKFITVPNEEDAKWIRPMIEKADPKASIVEIIVDQDVSIIKILQLRGRISLSPLIDKSNLDSPEHWDNLAAYAVDRTTAMMVSPNPNNRQLSRVIAKAIVTGQLIWDHRSGFCLALKDHDDIRLGQTADEAVEKLRHYWRYLVRIESTFTHHVFLDEARVVNRVENLGFELISKTTNDKRTSLIDATAVSELKKQMELLIPWTRRLHTAAGKGSLDE
jgi:hypothetical protein